MWMSESPRKNYVNIIEHTLSPDSGSVFVWVIGFKSAIVTRIVWVILRLHRDQKQFMFLSISGIGGLYTLEALDPGVQNSDSEMKT